MKMNCKKVKIKLTTCLIALVATAWDGSCAWSQAQTDNDSPATETQPQPGASLQGGVHMVAPSLETLRELSIDLKHLMAGASRLHDEVNIQPVSLETVPEVIGRGTIINIPIGTMPVGPAAPPRKERLDLAMAQITPIITQLKKSVDAFLSGQERLDISDETRTELKPVFDSWIKAVNNLDAELTELQPLVAGPRFDNAAISSSAVDLQNNCQILQKDLKRVYRAFQKEAKRQKRV